MRKARHLLGALVVVCVISPGIEGQSETPLVDLKRWATNGERTDIPWKIIISKAHLTFELRLQVALQVEVRGKDLLKKGMDHDLTLYMEMRDAGTSESLGHAIRRVRAHPGIPRRGEARIDKERDIVFDLPVFMLPGRYTASFVLYDGATGARSVARRAFTIKPIDDEALGVALGNTPRVEFAPSRPAHDPLLPLELKGHLTLPVESAKRVRLHVLVNCCAPQTVIQVLQVLSQIDLKHGSIHVCVLDTSKGRVVFERSDFTMRDWPSLKTVLQQGELSFHKFDGLFSLEPSARPFIDAVLRAGSPISEAPRTPHTSQTGDEVGILVVLSRPTVYTDRPPETAIGVVGGVAQVFYLKLLTEPSIFKSNTMSVDPVDRLDPLDLHDNVWDSIPRILKPFNPKVFTIHDPKSFGNALADIMESLAQL